MGGQVDDPVADLRGGLGTVTGGAAGNQRLTPTEWRSLELLVRHPGRLVTQRQVLTEIWEPAYQKETNYLRLYLAQLRRKLEPDPRHPRYLLTDPGRATGSSQPPHHDQDVLTRSQTQHGRRRRQGPYGSRSGGLDGHRERLLGRRLHG